MQVKFGMYEEYVRWRSGYHAWRLGKARGARGEGTHGALHATAIEETLGCFFA